MASAVLVYNPAAGRFPLSERRLDHLFEKLYRCGIRCEAVPTRPGENVCPPLDPKHTDLLIVYGGDGTLHHLLSHAVNWNIPVGLLPAGTANVLARELKIPLDPEQAIAVIARRKRRRIHLGQADHRYFHLMVGVGFDAFVLSRLNEKLKRCLGLAAFCWTTGCALFTYPFRSFKLRVQEEILEGTFAVISNARSYGGGLSITPRASVYESCLDICVFTGRRLSYLRYVFGTLTGWHLQWPDVIYRKSPEVEILAEDAVPIQMDGELIGGGVKKLRMAERTLEVIVP